MWFLFAIVSVLAWGTADLFYKKGSDPKDKYSYLKIVIMVGAVMGIHAVYVMLTSGVVYDPSNMITYLPVSALYILSMAVGYAGLRFLELSISSPVQNSSGASIRLVDFHFLGPVHDRSPVFCGGTDHGRSHSAVGIRTTVCRGGTEREQGNG